MRIFFVVMMSLGLALTTACSTKSSYKGVYSGGDTEKTLDVPPDLAAPDTNPVLVLPELRNKVTTYSDYQNAGKPVTPQQRIAKSFKGMRFVRDGALFWLETDAPAEEVWTDVRNFFVKVGFEIKNEQPLIGRMITNWKDNRVKAEGDWFSNLLSKAFGAELKDRYFIRIERDTASNGSKIFIRHQGLQEVVDGGEEELGLSTDVVTTSWAIRPSDPELEVEMLMRFMTYRGVDETQAKQQIASVPEKHRSKFNDQGQQYSLEVYEPFSRTWRHIGVALDRMGFYVEDRNRSAGVYYIKIPDYFKIEKSGLFSSKHKPESAEYLLTIEDNGDSSKVRVKARGEQPKDLSQVSEKILKQIQQNIL